MWIYDEAERRLGEFQLSSLLPAFCVLSHAMRVAELPAETDYST